MPDPKFFQPAPPCAANPDALAAAADALLNAKLPLIVGGRFGIDPAVTKPLVELVELTGAAYRDDLGMIAFPTAHPQSVSGDREIVKEADAILAIDCRDLSSLLDELHRQKERRRLRPAAPGRKVIDMSLNEMSPSSWSYLRGARAAGRRANQLRSALRACSSSMRSSGSGWKRTTRRARKVEQRKKLAHERHKALRARQAENARKGWDDKPIRPGRMVSELWDAVKDKNWLLAMRNSGELPGRHLAVSRRRLLSRHQWRRRRRLRSGRHGGRRDRLPRPGKFCVGLMGDGDFVMSAGAIWSAVHKRAPMLLVINNNTTWGNDEKHQMHVAEDRHRPVENAWIGQRMVDPDIDHATSRAATAPGRQARSSIRPSLPACSRRPSPRSRRAASRWSRSVPSWCSGVSARARWLVISRAHTDIDDGDQSRLDGFDRIRDHAGQVFQRLHLPKALRALPAREGRQIELRADHLLADPFVV